MTTCFICTHPSTPDKPYPYDSMRWFESTGKLCSDHIEKLKAMKPPAEKYVLKQEKPFVPPVIQKPMRDWNEREPNDGSLIE